MENILHRIFEERRQDAQAAAARVSFADLQRRVTAMGERRSLVERLLRVAGSEAGIVAEIKRASPSAGLLRADCDPAQIAAVAFKDADVSAHHVVQHLVAASQPCGVAGGCVVLPVDPVRDHPGRGHQQLQHAAVGVLVAGFLEAARGPWFEIIPDYVLPGIQNEALATILAGVIGVMIVLAAVSGVTLARRNQTVSEQA